MAGESITLIICHSYSGLADWDKQANFLVNWSLANLGQNQLNNNREIATCSPNTPALLRLKIKMTN